MPLKIGKFSTKIFNFIKSTNSKKVNNINDSIKNYSDTLEKLVYEAINDGVPKVIDNLNSTSKIDAASANSVRLLNQRFNNFNQNNNNNSSDNQQIQQSLDIQKIRDQIIPLFVTDYNVQGNIDGVNKIFTLSNKFYIRSTKVYVDGIRKIKDTDYIEINDTSLNKIEFTVAPSIGAKIIVDYIQYYK